MLIYTPISAVAGTAVKGVLMMDTFLGIIILLAFIEGGARVFFKFSPAVWLYGKIFKK